MTTRPDPAEESALSGPLRPTSSATMSTKESTFAETDGTAERARTRPRISDPRSAFGLSGRDLAVLGFLATVPFAAQYQVRERFFRGRSDVPGSRCVQRLLRLGFVLVQRWRGVGINLVRTTEAGRAMAMAYADVAEDDVFVSRWPSVSALPHTLWIIDALIAIGDIAKVRVSPCWALRRRAAGTREPVPDLLIETVGGKHVVVAEIDLATESIRRVVLPKISALRATKWSESVTSPTILILTIGSRRKESLERQIPTDIVPARVVLLPEVEGQAAIAALRALFKGL